jgi:hypothetical protein
MSTAVEVQDVLEKHDNHLTHRTATHNSDYSNEKGFSDGEQAASTEYFESQDVSRPFPVDPDYVEETHQLTVRCACIHLGL